MAENYKPVKPVLRIAAVCVGLVFLIGGVSLTFFQLYSFSWSMLLKTLVSIVIGSFFIYVGVTGKNFYWKPDQDDEQD